MNSRKFIKTVTIINRIALLAMIIVKTTFKVIDIVGFICIIGAVEVVAIKSAKKKKIE